MTIEQMTPKRTIEVKLIGGGLEHVVYAGGDLNEAQRVLELTKQAGLLSGGRLRIEVRDGQLELLGWTVQAGRVRHWAGEDMQAIERAAEEAQAIERAAAEVRR